MRVFVSVVSRFFLLLAFTLGVLSCATTQASDTVAENQRPVFYFFHSDLCPHCIEAKPFVAELKPRYPQVEFREMEVSNNPVNREIFIRKTQELGVERRGVPFFLIGKRYVVGFRKGASEEAIIALIEAYLAEMTPVDSK